MTSVLSPPPRQWRDMAQVTLELIDGSRRSVPASSLHEVTDTRWAHAHVAALAQKRSELEVATGQAFAREQEQVATRQSLHLARDMHAAAQCSRLSLALTGVAFA